MNRQLCRTTVMKLNESPVMSNYCYEAVDTGGLKMQGQLDVSDQGEALRRIKEMGLFPVKIWQARAQRQAIAKEKRSLGQVTIAIPFLSGRVKSRYVTAFTRQLATLIEAGMPLLRGLRILREQEENPTLKRIISELAETIESGGSLSEGLAAHPKVFNALYVNMTKAGEISGALEITLKRLADFMEKAQKIKGKVKAAMFYPVSVLLIAMVILTVMTV